jgi:hypothetical protein
MLLANDPVPDWIYELRFLSYYTELLSAFVTSPARFIRKRVATFIVSAVAAFAVNLGAVIRDAFGVFVEAFEKAAAGFETVESSAIDPAVGFWLGLNRAFAEGASDVLGPAAPLAIGLGVVLQAALILRAIPPALVAASDLLGSIPVIGSVLDAAATFAIEYIGGSDS